MRLLLTWYESTTNRTKFQKNISQNSFGISHSVRQGGILSCALFTVGIIDDLLAELELAGIGCKIKYRFFGALAFADDIILLCPTIVGLNQMLQICHKWAIQNNVEFNPTKSCVICFVSQKRDLWPEDIPIPVFFNGKRLPLTRAATHLGHILAEDLSDSPEINRIARSFNRQFNAFFNKFGVLNNAELKKHLYVTFCGSFYGIEAVNPNSVTKTARDFLKSSVNIALMKLLRLPRESISQFLIAEGILNAESMWRCRALNFWKGVIKSNLPTKTLLIKTNWAMICQISRTVNIFPTTLANLSQAQINNRVTAEWCQKKGV